MNKLFASLALVFSLSTFALSTETATTWVSNVSITWLYIGDYNSAYGLGHVICSDGKQYTINLGTTFGRLMYATALNAKMLGKNIDILKENAYINNDVNNFTADRILVR